MPGLPFGDIDLDDPSKSDPNDSVRGERSLLLAIIHQAICDVFDRPGFRALAKELLSTKQRSYRRHIQTKRENDQERALHWLMHEVDSKAEVPFSLDWCCHMLGMDARYIRKRIRVTLGQERDATVRPYAF